MKKSRSTDDRSHRRGPYRNIHAILAERTNTHGDFIDNARTMQWLKLFARDGVSWHRLSYVQREAIEMILHKVGRIVSGNPNTLDHWQDIAGYAQLAADRLSPPQGIETLRS